MENFDSSVFEFKQERDIFSFEVAADKITAVILFLKKTARAIFLLRAVCKSLSASRTVKYQRSPIVRQPTK
jgi:hypothetical protein